MKCSNKMFEGSSSFLFSFPASFYIIFIYFLAILACSLVSFNQLLLPIHGSRRYDTVSLPIPVSFEEKEGEKNAHSSTSRTDHKVSSAEVDVKRFKRAPEVSFAPSPSFPSHPTIPFPLLFSFPP